MEAFATVFAKDLTIVEGFRLRQPLVTVFTTSEKASDFAERVAMVRSSGEASSDTSTDRSAVAERHALPRHGPAKPFAVAALADNLSKMEASPQPF